MPPSVASDLGLYYLHMSHKKDTRLIWVKRHHGKPKTMTVVSREGADKVKMLSSDGVLCSACTALVNVVRHGM